MKTVSYKRVRTGARSWKAVRKAAKKNPKRVKLLGCPFDGGRARFIRHAGHLCHAIECSTCHASTTRYRLQWIAVDAWNHRVGRKKSV